MTDELERDLDLLALAEGGDALSPERRAELEAEIAGSPELAARFEATRVVVHFVDRIPPLEPSMGFRRQLERRLDRIDDARSRPWWRRLWPETTSAATLGWAAAATAAGVLAVVFMPPRSDPPPAVMPRALAQAELLEVAEDFELLKDLDVIEQLDVLEDLEVIEALDEGEPG